MVLVLLKHPLRLGRVERSKSIRSKQGVESGYALNGGLVRQPATLVENFRYEADVLTSSLDSSPNRLASNRS
jgi:hypothetical protein